MSTTAKFLETSFSSIEIEQQALVITVSNELKTVSKDYKEKIPPQNSLSDFPQNTTAFNEVKTSLHGPNTSMKDVMKIQETSTGAPLTDNNDSKLPQKNKTCELDSSKSQKRKNKFFE